MGEKRTEEINICMATVLNSATQSRGSIIGYTFSNKLSQNHSL